MAKILVVEDEQNLRLAIRRTLTKSSHEVSEAGCLKDARSLLEQQVFDLVLTDVMLGSETGMDLVRELRGGGFDGVIVVMTGFGTVENAVNAIKDGADDYLQKPLSLEELSLQTGRWLAQRTVARRLKLYQRLEQAREQSNEVLGTSSAWKKTLALADRLASVPLAAPSAGAGEGLPCILVLGETGVGKGVLARYIHAKACEAAEKGEGRRGTATAGAPPFVHVNCATLPATLVEAELFGHERGAFTDAREAKPGLFEMADGGTIFLDEISEMPLELQAKLLLAVEQGTFRRVGGSRERTVRVRVIAASNQDLEQRSAAGTFRKDLLYRLNAFTIRIPALREREGDAELMARSLLARFAKRYGRTPMTFSGGAVESIRRHTWPGNVRELVNCIQRASMLADSAEIDASDLGFEVRPSATPAATTADDHANGAAPAGRDTPDGALVFDFQNGVHTADEVEKCLIIQALERTNGNVSRAAKLIGMQRSSLRYRIERYKLEGVAQEVARR